MSNYEDLHAQYARLCRRLNDLDSIMAPPCDAGVHRAMNDLREQIAKIAREIQARPIEVRELIESTAGPLPGQRLIVAEIHDTASGQLFTLRHPGGEEVGRFSREALDTMTFTRHGKWSGKGEVPAIGSEVLVHMNGFGLATVVAHEVVEGWLGLIVSFHVPPDWYLRQNQGVNRPGLVFGAEIR